MAFGTKGTKKRVSFAGCVSFLRELGVDVAPQARGKKQTDENTRAA